MIGLLEKIVFLCRKRIWILEGRPMVQYKGFHCGICGKYIDKQFSIPKYESDGEWWDTWGLCENCKCIR